MKILILGAGRVGSTVAEALVSEENDVTLVDVDGTVLQQLQDRLDLRTVTGQAANPETLARAGADDCDLLLAVTPSDEINMVACKLADTLFNVPTKIARIRSADYMKHPELFTAGNFAVDRVICPEQIVSDHIAKLIDYPEALQVLEFANGRVGLVGVRAREGGLLVGHQLQELREHMPNIDTRVAAIYREEKPIIPKRDTVVEADDEVFFIAARENLRKVMDEMRTREQTIRRIMIAGGGNIGVRLAKKLETRFEVKLIEFNPRSVDRITDQLTKTLVLVGDATDEELLEAENVDEMDMFCSLTSDDESNIMAALLAKRLGARKVVALINRGAYAELMRASPIDVVLSPAQVTIGSLLSHLRRGDCVVAHSLRRGAAEALELIAHGDAETSAIVGRRVEKIKLPSGATIAALVRKLKEPKVSHIEDLVTKHVYDEVIVAHHDTVIEPDDHVIVFVVDKKIIPQVERLFHVAVQFA